MLSLSHRVTKEIDQTLSISGRRTAGCIRILGCRFLAMASQASPPGKQKTRKADLTGRHLPGFGHDGLLFCQRVRSLRPSTGSGENSMAI